MYYRNTKDEKKIIVVLQNTTEALYNIEIL